MVDDEDVDRYDRTVAVRGWAGPPDATVGGGAGNRMLETCDRDVAVERWPRDGAYNDGSYAGAAVGQLEVDCTGDGGLPNVGVRPVLGRYGTAYAYSVLTEPGVGERGKSCASLVETPSESRANGSSEAPMRLAFFVRPAVSCAVPDRAMYAGPACGSGPSVDDARLRMDMIDNGRRDDCE